MSQENNYQAYCRFYIPATKMGLKLSLYFFKRLYRWSGIEVKSILEIGPGRGLVGDWCKQKGIRYSAVEASENMASKIRKEGKICWMGRVPPLPAIVKLKRYDSVLLMNVLEHAANHVEALEIVKEISRVSSNILISAPQFNGYGFYRNVWDHSYPCSRERIYGLLAAAGGENIETSWMSGPFTGVIAWIWSRIGRIIPFELPKAIWPNNRLAIRWHKISSVFMLRIIAKATF